MQRTAAALVLALCVALSGTPGCGEDSGISVRFDEPAAGREPPLPSPIGRANSAAVPAPKPPLSPVKVPAVPPSPVPTAPAAPPAAASGSKPALPALLPHAVDVIFNGPFFPSVDISMVPTATLTGAVEVHDRASRDGMGASGKLNALMPGDYRVVLTAPRLPGYPMLETSAVVDGTQDTRVLLGSVQFAVPPKAIEEIGRGILVDIVEDPSRRPVFRGPMGQMKTEDSNGHSHAMMLLLPLGSYAYSLTDLDPNDRVVISPTEGRPGLVPLGGQNTFQLTGEHPSTIVDLRRVLVVR